MPPDEEVEFNLHLANGLDPWTALAALERDKPPRREPNKWLAFVVLAALVAMAFYFLS